MKNLFVGFLLIATCSQALASTENINTIAGMLSIIDTQESVYGSTLTLDGKTVYTNELIGTALDSRFLLNGDDVLLFSGGRSASCASYFFVTISQSKNADVSSEFGTCSDYAKSQVKGNSIIVTMPENQKKYAKFIFKNGVVYQNGKAILNK
jgi:hypothetical protein